MQLFPLCLNGKDHFTNSDGHWLPCCFLPSMGPRYDQLIFSDSFWLMTKDKDDEFFSKSQQFQNWIHIQMSDPKNANLTCQRMCNAVHKEVKRIDQDVQKFNLNKDTVKFDSLGLSE